MDCLPVIDRWGKGVWENVPDTGAEVRGIASTDPDSAASPMMMGF